MLIVNPNFSFSVTATINDKVILFLVDTGSALTILCRDAWEKCKEPQQQLVPWCQSKLVGAEGSQLRVFGSAVAKLNIAGESFDLSVVVIDPLTSEAILELDVLTQCTVDLSHKQLITGAGHVVNMYCQGKGQHLQWQTSVCEHETVNTTVCISKDQPLLGQVVDTSLPQERSQDVSHVATLSGSVDNFPKRGSSQFVDSHLPQEEREYVSCSMEESEVFFHAVDISDTMDNSQMGEPGHVLTVKIIDNIRIPAFSELEILAQVKCDGSRCYVLENNLKKFKFFSSKSSCYT